MRLKAEALKSNGGKPIILTPEEQQRLDELKKGIDPEVLKRIDVITNDE